MAEWAWATGRRRGGGSPLKQARPVVVQEAGSCIPDKN
jgi:hypothetical protein